MSLLHHLQADSNIPTGESLTTGLMGGEFMTLVCIVLLINIGLKLFEKVLDWIMDHFSKEKSSDETSPNPSSETKRDA